MSTPEEVKRDLIEFLDVAAGTHAFSLVGLDMFRKERERAPRHKKNKNPRIFWASGNPNNPGNLNTSRGWRRSDLLERLRTGGTSALYLGWAWATLVYDRWDDDYRGRFAAAMNCDRNKVMSDPMGELRLLRNDIAHGRGIATAKTIEKCPLLSKWMEPDKPILIDQIKVGKFVDMIDTDTSIYKAD